MQNQNFKFKMFHFGLCLLVFGLCGCGIVEYLEPEQHPYDKYLSLSYHEIKLKISSATDVLSLIHLPEYELLSQSKSVIASSGQKKEGHQIWFKMAAFDENTMTTNRKYFFLADERPKNPWVQPKRKLKFDSEMVMGPKVFAEPYVNDNARRIAILRKVLANVHSDIDQVGAEDKNLSICGMLINQTIETVLVKLESSPALATRLNPIEGLDFDHITLGTGKIWMGIAGEIVNIRIRVDSFVSTHDDPFTLED